MYKPGLLAKLLTHARSGTALIYLFFGLLLIAAVLIAGDRIVHHINGIETWVAKLGPWGGVALIALFVVTTSLLLPETVLSIMAGALFGVPWGLAAVVTGALLAAALQYALARKVLRPFINRALVSRPSLVEIRKAVVHEELKIQLLLRLTPLNPAVTSYLLGTVGVRFAGFLLACLALIPGMLISVYLGYAGKYAAQIAGRKSFGVVPHDLVVFGGLALTALIMVIVAKMAHKAIMQAVAKTEQ